MNVWTVLKTLLFTMVMILQSILSTITYTHPMASAVSPPKSEGSFAHLPTHSSLAVRWGHVDEQRRLRGVEAGVLYGAGCVKWRRRGE